jgi:hypothetical protein
VAKTASVSLLAYILSEDSSVRVEEPRPEIEVYTIE